MRFDILTLFPEAITPYTQASILGRAIQSGAIEINVHHIRDYANNKHKTVDDTPFGGGAGMVMMIEPIERALQAIGAKKGTSGEEIVLLSAKGAVFHQGLAREMQALRRVVLICGRYEGVDERVAEYLVDREMSIGEYVLTGGELGALVITDAVSRLLPGVLGNEVSATDESHTKDGELEYPQYTRPAVYQGWAVPEVLQSGNHELIKKWREENKKKTK